MRLFHKKVFDEVVEDSVFAYTSSKWDDLLGSVTHVTISGYATELDPSGIYSYEVDVEESPDERHWYSTAGSVAGSFVFPATEVPFVGMTADISSNPGRLAFRRFAIQLRGGRGRMVVWATGRGEELTSKRTARR